MSLVFGFVGNQDCLKFGMRLKIAITLSAKHSVPWNKTWHHLPFSLSIEHRIKNVTLTLDANMFFPRNVNSSGKFFLRC